MCITYFTHGTGDGIHLGTASLQGTLNAWDWLLTHGHEGVDLPSYVKKKWNKMYETMFFRDCKTDCTAQEINPERRKQLTVSSKRV